MSAQGPLRPLEVVAHLAGGLSFGVPWGIGLDGLLASALWHDQRDPARATSALQAAQVPDLDLPLARCEPVEGPWHWAATCCALEGVVGEVEARFSTQHLDQRALEDAAARLPASFDPVRGRWRRRHVPHLVTLAARARWRCVGDPGQIQQILEGIETIGKRRRAGEGQVLSWQVIELQDCSDLEAGHLHADGSLGRPVPPACMEQLPNPRHTGQGLAAIRPPAMHPSRMTQLFLPVGA